VAKSPSQVVCAIEPNDEAKEIVAVAATLARQSNAELTLMHVVEPPWSHYAELDFTPLVEANSAIENELREASLAKLRELAPDESTQVRIATGDTACEVAELVQSLDDAVVVMGIHNRRGLKRLLGSTAHRVLHTTDCPIMLVHPNVLRAHEARRLLVAVDTSKQVEVVLDHATTFAPYAQSVTLLNVIQPISAGLGAMQATAFSASWPLTDMEAAQRQANKAYIREALLKSTIKPDDLLFIDGHPAHEICKYAESSDTDLIIIGAGQHSVLDRILLGSTTHGVLNQCPCDIYIAR
jgi:universal stress protein A